jgi:hypothetical protein
MNAMNENAGLGPGTGPGGTGAGPAMGPGAVPGAAANPGMPPGAGYAAPGVMPGAGYGRGYNVLTGAPYKRKSPVLAGLLSMMPGLGQVYVGYYKRGFLHILIFASLVTILNSHVGDAEPFFGLFLAFFQLYNIIDAVRRATFYNQAMAGMTQGELPEDFKLPDARGSMMGGAILILLGVLFIAHNRFNYDLYWLRDWWPLLLVLIGANLMYQSYKSRNKGA